MLMCMTAHRHVQNIITHSVLAVHLPNVVLPQPAATLCACAAPLNALFTKPEVRGALANFKNGRAPGISGLLSELLRYAERERTDPQQRPQIVLMLALTAVLNSALQTRAVPAGLNLTLVTPCPQAGSRGPWRGLLATPYAVGIALLRLYAVLLNRRLVDYTEAAQLRAPMQAGFRPDLSTEHQVLTLQHLVDHAHSGLQPQALFCCFLDMKGCVRLRTPLTAVVGGVATPGRAWAHAGCRAGPVC